METPQNPYAPPEAPVADFEAPATGPCPHVELACRLLWISFGVSLIDNVAKIVAAPSTVARIAMIIGTLVGIAIGYVILAWITRKLRAGRNWMRWLYTVFSALGWLAVAIFWSFYRDMLSKMSYDSLAILSMTVSSVIGVAVLVLLHTQVTREWFRARSAAA